MIFDPSLFAMGVAAIAWDGLLTNFVLRMGGCELNPLLRTLVRKAGIRSALAISKLGSFLLLVIVSMVGDHMILVLVVVIWCVAAGFTTSSLATHSPPSQNASLMAQFFGSKRNLIRQLQQ